MALDQSALLELLEMMRSADAGELMRRLLGTIMQELVDAVEVGSDLGVAQVAAAGNADDVPLALGRELAAIHTPSEETS